MRPCNRLKQELEKVPVWVKTKTRKERKIMKTMQTILFQEEGKTEEGHIYTKEIKYNLLGDHFEDFLFEEVVERNPVLNVVIRKSQEELNEIEEAYISECKALLK